MVVRISLLLGAALGLAGAARAAADPGLNPADEAFFEAKIRPLLVEKCYKCHSHDADKVKGGLMLDTKEGWMAGGDTGPAIDPGKPDDSLLIQAVRYTDADLKMPPKGDRLSDQQVADLTEWIRRGAPDPRLNVAQGSSAAYGGVGRNHWSFLPLRPQTVPIVTNPAWCKTPIDNFVWDKLQSAGKTPNPAADKGTLIRRVTFDLTGLPPTEAEVQAFLSDDSPEAYTRVVDRLLASAHYGERWARYWMDVARYSDTKGDPAKPQTEDPRYPDAWTYRDYLIEAFNTDKPFNRFIEEQLAADRLLLAEIGDAKKHQQKTEPAIATREGMSAANFGPEQPVISEDGGRILDLRVLAAMGFLTLGNQFGGSQNDIINDRIDVTTKAFLGLTVSCARCHDHKFDPIPTKDYYALFGVFANSKDDPVESHAPMVEAGDQISRESIATYQQKLAALEAQKQKCELDLLELRAMKGGSGKDSEKAARRKEIQQGELAVAKQIADLESQPDAPGRALILRDVTPAKDYPVLLRGEAANKGPVVPRRFLEILGGARRDAWKKDSGRLELAQAIADPKNPLTARVLVNRIWQQHFGVGFVPTPDDLGNQSAPPSHPELLDYLAAQFMANGWSVKWLQRIIVLSAVYQESSASNPRYADSDPDNKLLWRYNLHRLDFEEIHDSLLQIAGTLDLSQVGGRSVQLGSADFAKRRAIYTYIDRRNPPELFTQFDFPNPGVPSGRRFVTSVPQQALFLMNSPLVIETARKLTHRPEFTDLSSDEERVASLFEAVYQRLPTPAETKLCLHYVETIPSAAANAVPGGGQRVGDNALHPNQPAKLPEGKNAYKKAPQQEAAAAAFRSRAPLDAWTKLAHALFQTNEAIVIT
jgi:cytochrome c553